MTDTKPNKTAVDYLAIAICPALIMALVGSLAFFLLELFNVGPYGERLHWTLFWFVFAIVLVGRIAIEKGSEYASLYAIGLALAAGLIIHRFLGFAPAVWVLLGIIWWATHKLTWDCTLIDDTEDASGEGLLQAAGLEKTPSIEKAVAANTPPETSKKSRKRPPSRWERLFNNRSAKDGQPHAPGLWVVWFSLAALPLFGVGQVLLPTSETARRERAFLFLFVYVAAGLGLLLLTSFLGLRRYLRQRQLQMPALMTGSWIGLGVALGGAILLLCLLLPRPDAAYSLTALAEHLGVPQHASQRDVLGGEAAQGEGRRAGKNGDTGEKSNRGEPTQPGGKQGQANVAGQQDGQRGAPSANAKNKGQSTLTPGSSTATPRPPSLPQTPGEWLKWLLYALFAGFVLWLLIRHGHGLLAALRELWQNFKKWFIRPETLSQTPIRSRARSRAFASFSDPFASGAAPQMSRAELVRETFEALQAWAHEQGATRRPDQTPLEFAHALNERIPQMATDIRVVTRHYTRWTYADIEPPEDCLPALENVWRQMRETTGHPLPSLELATR